MKTAAVIIDEWKLSIFRTHLDSAGYKYEVTPGVTDKTLTMKVSYEWASELSPIIEAAHTECAMISHAMTTNQGEKQ